MADINEYLDGLDIKFSEQEKQLADIFAESWEYCREHSCENCEYKPKGKNNKMLLCMSCQYAKRLIAADVAPVRHGHWIYQSSRKYINTDINEEKLQKEILGYCGRVILNLQCSVCRKVTMVFNSISYEYCPHCGAKIGGEGE